MCQLYLNATCQLYLSEPGGKRKNEKPSLKWGLSGQKPGRGVSNLRLRGQKDKSLRLTSFPPEKSRKT